MSETKKLIERLLNSGIDVKVTNTKGMKRLVDNAKGRNRSVYESRFKKALDPKGIHTLVMQTLHNDVEMRTMWYCKVKEDKEPIEIWLDVDFDLLNEVTVDFNELG
jgi:hypothetical protein